MKRSLLRWLGPTLVLFVLWRWAPRGEAPTLGVQDGQLTPCPESPNAVCSKAQDDIHAIAPIQTEGRMEQAWAHCRAAAFAEPGTRLVSESPGYMRFEATTRWCRFVDDVEFLADPPLNLIQVRSSSRIGPSDLGTNRRRVERIRSEHQKRMRLSNPGPAPTPTQTLPRADPQAPTGQPAK